eukprot:518-Heterococcus_DN1.PRE.1
MQLKHYQCEAAVTTLLLIAVLTLATLYTTIYTSCFPAAKKPQRCDYSPLPALQGSTLVIATPACMLHCTLESSHYSTTTATRQL